MKKQHSLLSPTKRQDKSFIAPLKRKKSVTFAELAEEEAREASDQINASPSPDSPAPKISMRDNVYERPSVGGIVSKGSFRDRKQGSVVSGRGNHIAANLKARPKFSKENAYDVCVRNEIIDDYAYNVHPEDKKLEGTRFGQLLTKSKSFIKGFSVVDQTNTQNGKSKPANDKERNYRHNLIANSRKGNRSEMAMLKDKMMELETENTQYVSNLMDIQAYAQRLESNIALQMKQDRERINKLEKLLEDSKMYHMSEMRSLSVSKTKEVDSLSKENRGLRENIDKMNAQLENLMDMHSRAVNDNFVEGGLTESEVHAEGLAEENEQLRGILQQMDSELRRRANFERVNKTLMVELKAHAQYQSSLQEENKILQSRVNELEKLVQNMEAQYFYKTSQQESDVSRLIDHLKCKVENQNEEMRHLKSDNEYLRDELKKTKLILSAVERTNMINKTAYDSMGHREIRELAIRTEDLTRDHNSLKEENCRYRNLHQEKTMKSTTVDSDGKDSDGFVESNNELDVMSSPQRTSIDYGRSENGDLMKSSTTFGIKLKSVEY